MQQKTNDPAYRSRMDPEFIYGARGYLSSRELFSAPPTPPRQS